jgi:glycosyltransferase involved in cell wall biosynthesis
MTYQKKFLIHVLNSLTSGGAERVALNSIKSMNNYDHIVIYIRSYPNELEAEFNKLCKVISIIDIKSLLIISKEISSKKVVLMSYMYISSFVVEIFVLLSAFFRFNIKHILQVHNGLYDPKLMSKKSFFTATANKFLLKLSHSKIIYCSETSKINHQKFLNYPDADVLYFYPVHARSADTLEGLSQRKRSLNAIAVISRWDKQKGVDWLISSIQSLEVVRRSGLQFHFYGSGLGPDNAELHKLLLKENAFNYVILHGFISDLDPIYEIYDLFLLPSRSEAMPQVVFEVINHGKLILSTDVGDVKKFISPDYLFQFGNIHDLDRKLDFAIKSLDAIPLKRNNYDFNQSSTKLDLFLQSIF